MALASHCDTSREPKLLEILRGTHKGNSAARRRGLYAPQDEPQTPFTSFQKGGALLVSTSWQALSSAGGPR